MFFSHFYFPSKKIRKENIQFSSWSFSPFLDFAHDAQNCLQNFWWLAYNICRVARRLGRPQVVSSNPAVRHIFFENFLDTR